MKLKRTCHICECYFDNLNQVKDHVYVMHQKSVFTRSLALFCYFEAMEFFLMRYKGNKGRPIPEMVRMFGPNSAFSWYGPGQPDFDNFTPWPRTYYDALVRAMWGLNDGVDKDLVNETNMIEMNDGLDTFLYDQAQMLEMNDGMDEELCILSNN